MMDHSELDAQTTVSAEAFELVTGKLYAIGGSVPMDGRISWLSAEDSGFQPVNGYLLKEGSSALLIDTGVALHRGEVLAQLSGLLDEQTRLEVFFTRAELDAAGNLVAIAAKYGVETVHAGGNVNPFDAFEEVGRVGRITANFSVQRVGVGQSLRVGDGRRIEVIRPPLRTLNTCWLYDAGTKTLFTSDAFGHTFLQQDRYCPILTSKTDTCDYAQLRRHTLARYWWLEHAVSPRVADDIEQLFEKLDPERIAPDHGCVLEGSELVKRHLGWLTQVLRGNADDARESRA